MRATNYRPLLPGIAELGRNKGRFRGKRVLILDDLYRSGATMAAVARTVREQGHATEIHVLALTRTRTRT